MDDLIEEPVDDECEVDESKEEDDKKDMLFS